MKPKILSAIHILLILLSANLLYSQEDKELKLSGNLMTDQRFLLNDHNDWAWNENRLTLNLEKKTGEKTKFYSEVWLRNIGLPEFYSLSDTYNKNIIDPYDIEIREAYVQINGFLFKNLDVKIGRQRIAWGKADKLNPTDNLNPYDFEDILDFGRHRGSDALSFDYYFTDNFSMHAIYIPFFKPANLPIGIFSDILMQTPPLPDGLTLKSLSDTLLLPKYNFAESSTAGIKFKGMAAGIDFSASYIWGIVGLPYSVFNRFMPVDPVGGININSKLSFPRTHIFGFDMAANLAGIGVWAEAAGFLPEKDLIMTNDLSMLYPASPVPVIQDTTVLKKELYTKFIIGADYYFSNGSYLNLQYLHGFIHEQGKENLNDYFFLNFDFKLLQDKLKIRPIGGGFIVSDWEDLKNNYSLVYMPEISYQASDNTEIKISTAVFEGKGSNIFSNLSEKNMFIFSVTHSF